MRPVFRASQSLVNTKTEIESIINVMCVV